MTGDMETSIAIGVSSCLLGESVRYDGGHKRNHYITDTLARLLRLVPVCPEVGCGMPTPREAMSLEGDPANPRLMTNHTRLDKTEQVRAYCRSRVNGFDDEDICGFIFKKDSPSCGLFRVNIYNNGVPIDSARGLFAAAVVERFPLLPVEEEESLNDPLIRESFMERVAEYRLRKDQAAARPRNQTG